MANFIDLSNITYCGKEAQEIFSKDIYDIDLRQDAWQLYTCPFTPAGSASLAEAFIEPAAIKVNQENCYDTFWNTFLVEQTEISLRGGIPQTFGDWYFGKLRQKMAKEYQEIFWKGDTGYTGTSKVYLKAVNGVEKELDSKIPAGNKITGSVITVANVIAQVEAAIMKGIDVANAAEVDTEGYKVFMNHADVRVLEVALGKLCCDVQNNRIFSNYGREGGRIFVMGYEIVPTMQSKNTIIFGPARNLVLGFDTYDSHLEYKLINMRETTGDNMFRVLAISNIAVGIILPELFVVSKP